MTYQFERDPDSGMILVTVLLDVAYKLKMVLDTGASRTTFDINVLRMIEYPINEITETDVIETANGIIEIGVFKVDSISAFGYTTHNMKVQVYDFLAHGILSDYNGVLGLDFFEDTIFRINMKNLTIEVKK